MQDIPMQIRGKEYYCSTRLTLDVIGGKWKMLVVWMLGLGDYDKITKENNEFIEQAT